MTVGSYVFKSLIESFQLYKMALQVDMYKFCSIIVILFLLINNSKNSICILIIIGVMEDASNKV